MGDIARCSIGKSNEYHNEELLYHLFGINAELLIDHAWGWEPCTMKDIKSYKPASSSLCSGPVSYTHLIPSDRERIFSIITLLVCASALRIMPCISTRSVITLSAAPPDIIPKMCIRDSIKTEISVLRLDEPD